jgi:hypothetical protein|uniref:Uncharacterized protein n=1 Tax=Siphoviridae sp. cthL03 TaxID=2825615 RepID=A0A8S5PHG3_9CAUD|nr:MAG TPA: hypothetical protein [Siphoviridae sp. cthL03]
MHKIFPHQLLKGDYRVKEKKNLKFIVRTERPITDEAIEKIRLGIEKFKIGESEIIVFPQAISIVVFDENNEYVTML